MQQRYSNYPFGFDNGILLKDTPVNLPTQSSVYWVGNNATLEVNEKGASDSNKGSYLQPFATLAFAISKCKANNVNTINVRAGYTQTITAAGGLTINVAGLVINGLGEGDLMPTLTFSTSTTASVLISAANVQMIGFTGVAAINGLTNPFNVQAAGCTLALNWLDGSSSIEAARAVLTSAAATDFNLDLRYIGFTGGSSCVNAVRLVGANNPKIRVDFYGKASTSVVEFVTTAVVNAEIGGYFYNASVTDASKDIVDTITGSTWFAYIEDGSAGGVYSGGSGSPLAPTTPASQTSIISNSERSVTRATANLPQTAAGNIFTVTGAPIEIISIVGLVTTVIQTQTDNAKLQITDTASSTTTDICATVNISAAAVGSSLHIDGTFADAMIVSAGGTAVSQAGRIICPVGAIKFNCSASNTGQVQWFMRYRPLGTAAVVAAA